MAETGKRFQEKKRTKKKGRVLKVILIILLVIILIIAGLVAGGYAYIHGKLSKINTVDINKDNIEINEGVEKQLKGYRNIALFGIDSRSDDYGVGNRSDCIIIASINEKTKDVKLTSVYRDSYLEITGRNLDKVTHAYSYGGPELAMSTLNTNLDLDITEFVAVNFDAVAEAVNALGGISISIDSSELKYINSYIDATSSITGISSKHVTTTGKQTLDGVQAVAYARIRYTSGGDYKRAERMRTVLEAMINKAKTKNIGELNELANRILPIISTNINTGDILGLIPSALSFNISNSIGWPYEVKGITLDRWYGVPVTLEESVVRLHKEIFGQENYEPSDNVKRISDKIIKKTGYQ